MGVGSVGVEVGSVRDGGWGHWGMWWGLWEMGVRSVRGEGGVSWRWGGQLEMGTRWGWSQWGMGWDQWGIECVSVKVLCGHGWPAGRVARWVHRCVWGKCVHVILTWSVISTTVGRQCVHKVHRE